MGQNGWNWFSFQFQSRSLSLSFVHSLDCLRLYLSVRKRFQDRIQSLVRLCVPFEFVSVFFFVCEMDARRFVSVLLPEILRRFSQTPHFLSSFWFIVKSIRLGTAYRYNCGEITDSMCLIDVNELAHLICYFPPFSAFLSNFFLVLKFFAHDRFLST